MEKITARNLVESFAPEIYLLIGIFIGIAISLFFYFVLNLKSPLMESINDDFAKDRPVTVFEQKFNESHRWEVEIGKGIARSSKDGFIDVEMKSGHGMRVPMNLIRFNDTPIDKQ